MTVWVLSFGTLGEDTLLDVYASEKAGIKGAENHMKRDSLPAPYNWTAQPQSNQDRNLGIWLWKRPANDYLWLRPRPVME